ncbi:MAG: FAD-dependent oxidoreductase [Calditrichaeota bacterium]|nr:FAD-dependent oxidoreductase [Calditrichota bacterium]
MALMKKKKKLKIQAVGASGASGAEHSPRRPYQIEKLAPCMGGCPQGTNIRGFLMRIAQAEKYEQSQDEAFNEAWEILTETNPLPAICGRVCPHPCEDDCNRIEKEGSLSINSIERFLGDWGIKHDLKLIKLTDETHPEKIAVIGAGPAGLSAAYHLARRGYSVTIFEQFPHPGGMLRYGIPEYRLPREIIDAEVQKIVDLGVELKLDVEIGKDIPYEQLQKDYDAIFVGMGAHGGKKLRAPGENASNVLSGVKYLRDVHLGNPPDVGDDVVVIGGGDTAIDAARVALRFGAKNVTILYRRTRNEMPAIEEEIVGAEEENIKFHFLAAPIELILKDDKAIEMRCQQMELGEPDDSGRRRPVPIEGDEFTIPVSAVIPAISQQPDWGGLDHLHEGPNWIQVDENFKTDHDKTYSGGDVLDLGLVTGAIYQGRRAAETIHCNFRDIVLTEKEKLDIIKADKLLLSYYDAMDAHKNDELSVEKRVKEKPWAEITSTLSEADVIEEAKRCMSCGDCFDCGQCWSFCGENVISKPLVRGKPYVYKLEVCNGCDKCAENCPCGYLVMLDPAQAR